MAQSILAQSFFCSSFVGDPRGPNHGLVSWVPWQTIAMTNSSVCSWLCFLAALVGGKWATETITRPVVVSYTGLCNSHLNGNRAWVQTQITSNSTNSATQRHSNNTLLRPPYYPSVLSSPTTNSSATATTATSVNALVMSGLTTSFGSVVYCGLVGGVAQLTCRAKT